MSEVKKVLPASERESRPNSVQKPELIGDGSGGGGPISIAIRISEATKELDLAKIFETQAKMEAEEAAQKKQECSQEIARVQPLIEGILEPLKSLTRNDVASLKSMKNPPPPVKMVLACVCVLKGIKPQITKEKGREVKDYWGPSQKMLRDINFVRSLKDLDKDNIPPEVMDEIRRDYIRTMYFSPRIMAMTSTAAAGLCTWVRALNSYDTLIKEIAPVKTRLFEAEKTLEESSLRLTAKGKEIEELEAKLAQLNAEFSEANGQNKNFAAQTDPVQSEDAEKDESTESAAEHLEYSSEFRVRSSYYTIPKSEHFPNL